MSNGFCSLAKVGSPGKKPDLRRQCSRGTLCRAKPARLPSERETFACDALGSRPWQQRPARRPRPRFQARGTAVKVSCKSFPLDAHAENSSEQGVGESTGTVGGRDVDVELTRIEPHDAKIGRHDGPRVVLHGIEVERVTVHIGAAGLSAPYGSTSRRPAACTLRAEKSATSWSSEPRQRNATTPRLPTAGTCCFRPDPPESEHDANLANHPPAPRSQPPDPTTAQRSDSSSKKLPL